MGLPKPTSDRVFKNERLSAKEVKHFMDKYGFSVADFAQFLGVTTQAVNLWLTGERLMTVTNSRLITMFIEHPTLMKKF